MRKIKLHYASQYQLELQQDILVLEFEDYKALMREILLILNENLKYNRTDIVYLFTNQIDPDPEKSTIIVSNRPTFEIDALINIHSDIDNGTPEKHGYFNDESGDMNFFLQEYKSFESAYSVALSMREGCAMCYDN